MTSTSTSPNWPAVIDTPRLRLRPPAPEDVPSFMRLWTDAEVRKFVGGPVHEEYLPDYERALYRRPYLFSVIVKEDSTFVGMVSVDAASRFGERREVSYELLHEHWGRGYAREAVAAVIRWGFDAIPSDNPSIIAVTSEENARSRRLLEAIGMVKIESFDEFGTTQTMYSATAEEMPETR
ncbi:GNAT family N-acetyltransferase [Glycomyces sp. L485]|uniref:GNAT family N-acetyltransferase n=1 Tax=Glycomyces sp. L485 TaxID=2909235 RepID=UPI001F4B1C6C|nr:GNAT family N-acetyltransferase [Glycomyces sp. L485]MCH7231670.1 GNAT family N-acetyltransferase [Glycomyces sp. L485]